MHETDLALGHGGIFQLPDEAEPLPGWHLEVSPDMVGLRVDTFICRRIPRLSRSRASRLRLIDLRTWRTLKKSAAVELGQQILAIRPIPDAHPKSSISPELVWENEQWFILNKPPNLATHPSASYFRRTVSYWLRMSGYSHMQSVHRLDVETSGLLVCAKTSEAVKVGSDAFANQEVDKRYLAIVEGLPAEDEWHVDLPLGFDNTSKVPIKMGHGRLSASTYFRVLGRGTNRTLLEARTEGGRQHQIRVHASLCGHPLVGDKLYGPNEDYFLQGQKVPTAQTIQALGHWRHALHAYQLTAEFLPKTIRIKPPKDWLTIKGLPDNILDIP